MATQLNDVITGEKLNEYTSGLIGKVNEIVPTMLANKFSKGDLYSTTEKMIGQCDGVA